MLRIDFVAANRTVNFGGAGSSRTPSSPRQTRQFLHGPSSCSTTMVTTVRLRGLGSSPLSDVGALRLPGQGATLWPFGAKGIDANTVCRQLCATDQVGSEGLTRREIDLSGLRRRLIFVVHRQVIVAPRHAERKVQGPFVCMRSTGRRCRTPHSCRYGSSILVMQSHRWRRPRTAGFQGAADKRL